MFEKIEIFDKRYSGCMSRASRPTPTSTKRL